MDVKIFIKQKKAHWKPKKGAKFYWVNKFGNVESDEFDDINFIPVMDLITNYNAFPSYELAERARYVSKLERLILLWQYNNDCLSDIKFLDFDGNIFVIACDWETGDIQIDKCSCRWFCGVVFFETYGATNVFIEMYEKEIKKLWGI